MKLVLLLLLTFVSSTVFATQTVPRVCSLDTQRTYDVLKKAAEQDQARLWGQSIDGAFLLVNPANREAEVIVETAPELRCISRQLPPDKPVANTCIELDGKPIASLMLPLPTNEKELVRLSTHERWHCLQKALGLAAQGDDNAHLDTATGRTMLRMELRALGSALDEKNKNWKRAAADAIVYRAQRSELKTLDSGVLLEEAKLEANEGLAEYTGQRFSEEEGSYAALIGRIKEADHKDSYLRSFAYYTGPAYGILLDRCKPGWQRDFKTGNDLPSLLAVCLGKLPPEKPDMNMIGKRYGFDEVLSDENIREATRQKRLEENTALFVNGRYLELSLLRPNIQFDPNNLFVLPGVGTVYQGLALADNWGNLSVVGPALVDRNWRFARVPLKAEGCALADVGGSLILNQEYEMANIGGKGCAISKK